MTLTKRVLAEIKAAPAGDDEPDGVWFEGYAAVFGNVDEVGDMVMPGAFADTLAARYPAKGAGVPVLWNHDVGSPFANLGVTEWAVEDGRGLRVRAFVDGSTAYGRQVGVLLKAGRVTQMSFAFTVQEGALVDSDEHGLYYELRRLDLHEVSIVPIGANLATEIVSVKALALQAAADEQAAGAGPVDEAADGDRPADGGGGFGRRETAARRLRAAEL